MPLFALLKRPSDAKNLLAQTVLWYFLKKPANIAKTYGEYAFAIAEILSIWFLVKTLFKPWKNIVEAYPKSCLQFDRVAQAFFLNLTTRVVGALVRLCVIMIGLIAQLAALVWFAAYFGLWLSFPFIVPALMTI